MSVIKIVHYHGAGMGNGHVQVAHAQYTGGHMLAENRSLLLSLPNFNLATRQLSSTLADGNRYWYE